MTTKTQSIVSTWDKKDEWHRHGENFLVVVKHSTDPPSIFDPYEGTHRWNVYAYIYPKHWRFSLFDGQHMYQDAASALPLHGGPSSLRWHYADDGKPCSVQIGSDYNHLHDTHFSCYATAEEAWQVFDDANDLFDVLSKKELEAA